MQNPDRRQQQFAKFKPRSPLKVGIIGCGYIAEHHLRFIAATDGAEISALSDPVISNAQRFGKLYNVKNIYSSYVEMLDSTPLDVVHILTPPEYHYSQAQAAIDHGVHVLVEKPCTLYPDELEKLYEHSEAKGVFLCPDFIQLFHPSFLQAASLIDSGKLGSVVHMDIHLGVDPNAPELREAKSLHWRYKLPGGIFHDTITHPLYLAIRWLGPPTSVAVAAQSHGSLPQQLTDHINIMLRGTDCTANIVVSAQIKPEPYFIEVFCQRGTVLIDFNNSVTRITSEGSLPRFVRRATASFDQSSQFFASGLRNLINYSLGKLLPYQGLQKLIPMFYSCILNGTELPLSRELAIAVARTEAAVFAGAGKLHLNLERRPGSQRNVTRTEKILVTGAAGYVGSAVVQNLVKDGYNVRAIVRALSHTERLEALGVELVYGDIRDLSSLIEASEGIDIIMHIAAAIQGSLDFMMDCSVGATRNIAQAARVCHVKRVIYMSSMSVYDYLKLRDGDIITEQSPLEEFPQERGLYSLAKRRAEDEALSHLADSGPSWTILRPSLIVGNGRNVFSPVGKKLGNLLICPGSLKKILLLIHVDDVAEAINHVVENKQSEGRVFNLSHEGITQEEYIDECIRKSGYDKIHVVYIPFWVANFAAKMLRVLRILNRRIPVIHNRQLASLYRDVRSDNGPIGSLIGWAPGENLLKNILWRSVTKSSTLIQGDP